MYYTETKDGERAVDVTFLGEDDAFRPIFHVYRLQGWDSCFKEQTHMATVSFSCHDVAERVVKKAIAYFSDLGVFPNWNRPHETW